MDARPAVMRQWLDRKGISQKRHSKRGNKGETVTRTAQTPENDGASERSGLAGRLPAPRSQKRPGDQTGEVKPGRGSHDQSRVRTPREGQEKSQTELKPWRELEDPTLTGTPKVSSRDGATGSDSKPTDPEEEEKPTLR